MDGSEVVVLAGRSRSGQTILLPSSGWTSLSSCSPIRRPWLRRIGLHRDAPAAALLNAARRPDSLTRCPNALAAILSSTPIGKGVQDPELLRSLARHIQRLWSIHLDEIDGWPTGHTADGTSIHVCYRGNDNVIEAFGTSWYDFGPDVFAFRARFRAEHDDQATVELAVEATVRSGGPRRHSVICDTELPETYRRNPLPPIQGPRRPGAPSS